MWFILLIYLGLWGIIPLKKNRSLESWLMMIFHINEKNYIATRSEKLRVVILVLDQNKVQIPMFT